MLQEANKVCQMSLLSSPEEEQQSKYKRHFNRLGIVWVRMKREVGPKTGRQEGMQFPVDQ